VGAASLRRIPHQGNAQERLLDITHLHLNRGLKPRVVPVGVTHTQDRRTDGQEFIDDPPHRGAFAEVFVPTEFRGPRGREDELVRFSYLKDVQTRDA